MNNEWGVKGRGDGVYFHLYSLYWYAIVKRCYSCILLLRLRAVIVYLIRLVVEGDYFVLSYSS